MTKNRGGLGDLYQTRSPINKHEDGNAMNTRKNCAILFIAAGCFYTQAFAGVAGKDVAVKDLLPKTAKAEENHAPTVIKLEAPEEFSLKLQGGGSTQQVIEKQAIALVVDVKTDWTHVWVTLAGALFTALLVAYISSIGQRTQQRSVLANIRKEWQKELRDACTEITGVGLAISATFKQGAGTTDTLGEIKRLSQRFFELRARIELLLDPDVTTKGSQERRAHRDALRKALEAITSAISPKNSATVDLGSEMQKFRQAAKLVLEDAWQDVKNDVLGVNDPPTVFARTIAKVISKIRGDANIK